MGEAVSLLHRPVAIGATALVTSGRWKDRERIRLLAFVQSKQTRRVLSVGSAKVRSLGRGCRERFRAGAASALRPHESQGNLARPEPVLATDVIAVFLKLA